MEEIGWPKGAFSVLLCGIPVAEKLVKDERIAMLSFTGSDKVGWHLKAICGKKKVALELGGNASVIIDEGVDLPAAAKTVAMGANLYAGQTCISTQRIYVVKSVHSRNSAICLVKEYNALKPAIRATQRDRWTHHRQRSLRAHRQWVDEAVKGGANLLAGGKGRGCRTQRLRGHAAHRPTKLT
jgi:acyl-CoA reductase-like NAD-dependent aldehyde dehydrogenase